MAENLQGGHECAFATIIGTDQYRQTIGRFDDRMPMRHEVDKFNPFNHWGPLLLRFEKSIASRRIDTFGQNEDCRPHYFDFQQK